MYAKIPANMMDGAPIANTSCRACHGKDNGERLAFVLLVVIFSIHIKVWYASRIYL